VCLEVFRNFKGIEHRLEYVRSVNGVDFINDSKSTTVDSTVWALNNISSPVLLIAGGRDKGSDYGAISGLIRQRSKNIILIGEARQKIRKALEGYRHIDEAASLKEAVRLAFSRAAAGDCVLLSPMCSSYDMFTNFEERGRAFKEAVFELAKDDA
ncbi:MAG: cyanophycin synthetase, partial [Candidatus Omnitrophota bacterium]